MVEGEIEDLDEREREVLRILDAARRPLNTNQVAERADWSWQTANKYLKRLYRKQFLRKRADGNSTYWRIR